MTNSPRFIFLIVGILFLIGAPLCYVGAGAYSYAQPRLYSSSTGFQLLLPDADVPRLESAFQKAKQDYPSQMKKPLTVRTELQQSGAPDQYRITAIDADALATANAANLLTMLVTETLMEASKEDGKRVNIFQKADIPTALSFPNVQRMMMIGMVAAAFCGAAGVVSFVIAFATRKSGGARI